MVKVDLITGFLGAGKTTFIRKYAQFLIDSGYHIGILENDFGAVNVDMMLLQDLSNPNLSNDICPQEEDYNDAKKVCETLNIPLHRVDYVKEYWDNVFTYFLDELKKGRTPNPDVMCNKYIKFDLFINKALELGADYIATGHYAKIIDGNL